MKTFTKEQLKEILDKHGKWLRNEEGGELADLNFADLHSANLHSADLRFADLHSANLHSADLRFADLRSADFRSADLRYADLRSANLRYADLRYADLRSANLSSADLYSANLSSADLLYFTGRRHTAYFVFDGNIRIGCHNFTIEKWAAEYQTIGEKEGYEPEDLIAYGGFIRICAEVQAAREASKKGDK